MSTLGEDVDLWLQDCSPLVREDGETPDLKGRLFVFPNGVLRAHGEMIDLFLRLGVEELKNPKHYS